jgi:hypothetical protein
VAEIAAIRLAGLARDDVFELEGYVGADALGLEEEAHAPDGSLPEPGTVIAIVALTYAFALKGLVAFLALRRRGSRISHRIEYETASGDRFSQLLEVEIAPGETPEAAVLRELGSMPDLRLPQVDSGAG